MTMNDTYGYSNIACTMVTMVRLNKEPKKLEDKLKNHNEQIHSVSETTVYRLVYYLS